MSRYDLTDFEWSAIEPVLPRKSRGVSRVDDRRVLNGIFRVLRSGAPWADLPGRYGPRTTCYNHFRRWTKAGVWDRIMDAVTAAHDGDVQMIDGTSLRVHPSAYTLSKAFGIPPNARCVNHVSGMNCQLSLDKLTERSKSLFLRPNAAYHPPERGDLGNRRSGGRPSGCRICGNLRAAPVRRHRAQRPPSLTLNPFQDPARMP